LRKVGVDEFEQQRYEYYKRLQEDFFSNYRIESLKPYRVKTGDSLWTICRDQFDIPLWLLRQCNPDVDFSGLRVHQDLIIPAVVSS
jgi:membrane-bound lytic murein transglycosylase D